VAVNEERTDRNYLFGRLLAVADVIKGRAMSGSDDKRPTNASRYMNAFSMRPVSTWKTIQLAINPYQQKLTQKNQSNCQKDIDDIIIKFEEGEFSNKELNGQFILGYSSQRNKMFTSTKKNNKDNGGENNDNTSK